MRVWGRTSVRPKALDQPYGKILSGKGLLLSTSGLQMRPCRTCVSDLILLYPAKSPRVRVLNESPWLIYLKWRYICALTFEIREWFLSFWTYTCMRQMCARASCSALTNHLMWGEENRTRNVNLTKTKHVSAVVPLCFILCGKNSSLESWLGSGKYASV